MLWRDGMMTIATHQEDAKKSKTATKGIGKVVNKITGKQSKKVVAFCDFNWGETSRQYMASVDSLPERAWKKIVEGAMEFVKASERTSDSTASTSFGIGD